MLTTQDGPPLLLVSPGQRGATGPGLPPRPVRLGARHGDQRADGLARTEPGGRADAGLPPPRFASGPAVMGGVPAGVDAAHP